MNVCISSLLAVQLSKCRWDLAASNMFSDHAWASRTIDVLSSWQNHPSFQWMSPKYIYMFMSAFLCLYLKQNRIQFSTACGSPVSVCAWRWWGPGAQHRSKQLLLLLENAEVSCSFCFHGPVFCWQLLACCLAFPSCFFLSLWVPWSRGRSPRRRMLFRRGSLPCSWRRWWRPLSREFASSEGVVC